jgi:hypothetical protein
MTLLPMANICCCRRLRGACADVLLGLRRLEAAQAVKGASATAAMRFNYVLHAARQPEIWLEEMGYARWTYNSGYVMRQPPELTASRPVMCIDAVKASQPRRNDGADDAPSDNYHLRCCPSLASHDRPSRWLRHLLEAAMDFPSDALAVATRVGADASAKKEHDAARKTLLVRIAPLAEEAVRTLDRRYCVRTKCTTDCFAPVYG